MAIYLCPSTGEICPWEGPGCDVVAHFEDHHSEHFLVSNQLILETRDENRVNYMMNLFGQTYLVQTNYSKTNNYEKIELKLRYLGSPEKASKIRYHLEVVSGNFGFTSNSTYDGYNTITCNSDSSITIDVQGIKLTCGTNKLDHLIGYIHVENDSTEYAYRSIRRRTFDNKSLETRVRSSVKKRLSQRSSIRRNSTEKMEFVDAIKNCNQDEHNLENGDYKDIQLHNEFVHDIMEDIFRRAMEKVDHKDSILRTFSIDNCPVSDIKYLYDHQEKKIIMDVVEFKTREEIFKIPYDTMVTQHNTNEDSKIIDAEEPILREGFVTKYLVPNAELPCTEYIEDDMRNSQNFDNKEAKNDAEIKYLKKLEAIRCKNCSMFMIPPIFMCLNGHSVCVTCKTLMCDICDQEVTDVRNYDLEDISRSVNHPCRFRSRGCRDSLSCYEIRFHEVYCDHCIYVCPLCPKMGCFGKIRGHIKLVHPSLKIVETNEHPFARDSAFVIANKWGMFYCTSQVKNSSIEWKVQYCGTEMVSFGCEVRIKGKKNNKCYRLHRNGHVFESYIFLNELKSARVKEKYAMLHMSPW